MSVLCDVGIDALSSASENGRLYFSELFVLKLSLCFSDLLEMNCGLEFLKEELSENVSASTSAMSFLVVASVYFFFFFFFCEEFEGG